MAVGWLSTHTHSITCQLSAAPAHSTAHRVAWGPVQHRRHAVSPPCYAPDSHVFWQLSSFIKEGSSASLSLKAVLWKTFPPEKVVMHL